MRTVAIEDFDPEKHCPNCGCHPKWQNPLAGGHYCKWCTANAHRVHLCGVFPLCRPVGDRASHSDAESAGETWVASEARDDVRRIALRLLAHAALRRCAAEALGQQVRKLTETPDGERAKRDETNGARHQQPRLGQA